MTTTLLENYTGTLTTSSDSIRRDLGSLMAQLTSNYNGEPLDEKELDIAVRSPLHAELVAIRNSRVVGAGSLSILPFSYSDNGTLIEMPAVWLASFVVDADHRGRLPNETASIATQLWDSMLTWTKEQNISSVQFMTEIERGAAINFYKNKNAVEIHPAMLYNIPLTPATPLDPSFVTDSTQGIIYETCKTYIPLHLLDSGDVVTPQKFESDRDKATSQGISLMQYIAATGSNAHTSLSELGLSPHREEMIMKVDVPA